MPPLCQIRTTAVWETICVPPPDPPLILSSADLAGLIQWTPAGKTSFASLPPMEGPAFVQAMLDKRLYRDANRAIPFLLSNRMACWWASLCIWHSLEKKLTPPEQQALDGCIRWIIDPSLEHRRSASDLADSTPSTSAVSCLGAAISVAVGGPSAKPRLSARLCTMAAVASYFAAGRQSNHREAYAIIGSELIHGRSHWALPPAEASRSQLYRIAKKGTP